MSQPFHRLAPAGWHALSPRRACLRKAVGCGLAAGSKSSEILSSYSRKPAASSLAQDTPFAASERATRRSVAAALVVFIAGCGGRHHALDSAGPQAAAIESNWWFYLAITTVLYIAVLAWVVWSLVKRRAALDIGRPILDLAAVPPDRERRLGWVVGGLTAVSTIILFALLFSDFATGRTLQAMAHEPELSIRLKAHQWWWEVQYLSDDPSQMMTTANEIHLPVGRPVRIELQTVDVIHSFWVPNLHGKRDMIPGQPTETYLRADREGTYWGECAEFCGAQHANMRLVVVAEPADRFQAWLNGQRREAAEPTTPEQKRGREVFLGSTCVMCHKVRGTLAGSEIGPDLTHVGSRQRLAAGAVPNTRGHLLGWVTDPQGVKPGTRMPMHAFTSEELQRLGDYLESLK